MNFKFSFTEKKELIYIDAKPNIHEIGSLLTHLIDTDWNSLSMLNRSASTENNSTRTTSFAVLKKVILKEIRHPAIRWFLSKSESQISFFNEIERLRTGSKLLLRIFESLVDEVQNSYEECLLSLLSEDNTSEFKEFFDTLDRANIVSVAERNKQIYSMADDFSFLFETCDLMTIAIQELQFICSNHFYVRKCAHCKKFTWTRKMNKIYCDREFLPGKTCSQIGPVRTWKENNPRAYALYWSYRKRLFNRATNEQKDILYHQWLSETEVYRDLAKKDQIGFDDMKAALDSIEAEIYRPVSGF